METLTSGCFTCSQLKWKATNLLVNQLRTQCFIDLHLESILREGLMYGI